MPGHPNLDVAGCALFSLLGEHDIAFFFLPVGLRLKYVASPTLHSLINETSEVLE